MRKEYYSNSLAPLKSNTAGKRFISFLKRDKYLLLLSLPGVLIVFAFRYLPIYGICISFVDFNPFLGILHSQWMGLTYFKEFINDMFFVRVVRNTVILGVLTLLFTFPAPIVLALFLNEVKASAFKRITQTISYLPYFLSIVIVIGIIRRLFSLDGGIVNVVLRALGINPIGFLVEPGWFRFLYISSALWQSTGFGAIIYLATISNIDVEMYEAAIIDGANRFRMIINITIPSIVPTIIILLVLGIGGIVSSDFTKIFLLYSPATYITADVISTYVYRQGITSANYSYSTAIGLMNSLVAFLFIIFANYTARKFSENSLW